LLEWANFTDIGDYLNQMRDVTVGILTYKRPDSLTNTLNSMAALCSSSAHHRLAEVLIIDNDPDASARMAVAIAQANGFPHPLSFHHEPEPGISAGRNRAMDEAKGSVLVFIDDDELALEDWPDGLIRVMDDTGASLVGGPVRTEFEQPAPAWITQGGFFDRAEPADQQPQRWLRSGNLAIDLERIRRDNIRFDPAFGLTGGEDVAFSRTARKKGHELSWSATAVVVENVGPERTRLRWLTDRERNSTANWVRVETFLEPGVKQKVIIASRAAARLGEGIGRLAIGLATLNRPRAATGLVTIARGIGSIQGLASMTQQSYL